EVDSAAVGGGSIDELPPLGGCTSIAAQQVNLGAIHVRQPAIAIWRHGGQRVDQRRCRGGAPQGEQCLSGVGGHDACHLPSLQASLPGNIEAAQRHVCGVLELRELEQSIAFVDGQPHQRRAVLCGPGQCPPPLQGGEPLL